jgi:hypothetical protein
MHHIMHNILLAFALCQVTSLVLLNQNFPCMFKKQNKSFKNFKLWLKFKSEVFTSFKQFSKQKQKRKEKRKRKIVERPRGSTPAQARFWPTARLLLFPNRYELPAFSRWQQGPTCHPVRRIRDEHGEPLDNLRRILSSSGTISCPSPKFPRPYKPPLATLVPLQNPRPPPLGCSKTKAAAPPQSDESIVVSL